jgi:hypothetical protein
MDISHLVFIVSITDILLLNIRNKVFVNKEERLEYESLLEANNLLS